MPETYADRNTLLKQLGYNSYAEYLASPLWQRIRTLVIEFYGNRCKVCARRATTTHHLSYKRRVLIGYELESIVRLCESCHYKIEFDAKGTKRSLEAARTEYQRLIVPKKTVRCLLCGCPIRKNGGPCRACNGTGITTYPRSRKATSFLESQNHPR